MIFSIQIDEFNFLWASTDVGINRINFQTGTINHYLKNVEFNKRSYHRSEELLFFGSLTGVFQFKPEDFIGDDILAPAKL